MELSWIFITCHLQWWWVFIHELYVYEDNLHRILYYIISNISLRLQYFLWNAWQGPNAFRLCIYNNVFFFKKNFRSSNILLILNVNFPRFTRPTQQYDPSSCHVNIINYYNFFVFKRKNTDLADNRTL